MNQTLSAPSITNLAISNDAVPQDTIDSIRLTKRVHRMSEPTINWAVESRQNSMADIDIDKLDAEFERLSFEFKRALSELRKDPTNLGLQASLTSTREDLLRIKSWSSLLNTADGRARARKSTHEQRERDLIQRKYEIDEILQISKTQSAVDLCFLMDCTGSMRQYLDAAKAQISQLTQAIFNSYSIKPRLAFVGYRDIDDMIEKLDFTYDENKFKEFLTGIQAKGGDDACEDVFSGLEVIPQLSWSNPNRLLIHICDAPCHGQEYHEFEGTANDNYIRGDPKHRDLSKLLFAIKRLNITYCKIELNDTTRKMFHEFAFIFGTISEIHVNNSTDLMKGIIEKTSVLLQSNYESTLSSYHCRYKPIKKYTLLSKEPDWNLVETLDVSVTEMILPNRVEDLFCSLPTSTTNGQIRIAAHPFAKGSLRFAFYGQYSNDSSAFVDVVLKEFASTDTDANAFVVYREYLEIQAIAQFLAEIFNRELQLNLKTSVPILYADACLVQQKLDPSKIYQIERRMHQEWRKWNNNSGGVSSSQYSTILQAFSHWTHYATSGRLMVVDLQGVKSDHAYLLTDPALHCSDLLRFRATRTNFGVKGMQQFFRTHVCSEVCTKLNLPVIQIAPDEIQLSCTDSIICHATSKSASDTATATTIDDDDFQEINKNQFEMDEDFELC